VAAELALLVGIARRHRLEVGARAEIAAGAGEHRDRALSSASKRKERVVQFARGRAVDGVAAMRAVDGNDGEGPSRSTSTASASDMERSCCFLTRILGIGWEAEAIYASASGAMDCFAIARNDAP
jgi:hypothetical protein